uniref:Uncharacterized protein n=1 Tax=Rhizophora mucronata TaxID=61149 RepID=A0A2P2NHL6_RHIMU
MCEAQGKHGKLQHIGKKPEIYSKVFTSNIMTRHIISLDRTN